jgi:hypothetical protein
MVPRFRRLYNATFDAARYDRYSRDLVARLGCEVGYRLAETPVFFERGLADACATAAREIVAQLAEPTRSGPMRATVDKMFAGGAEGDLPQFAVVDFAIAHGPGDTLVPQLVELQGFPSLVAFELFQHAAWEDELRDAMHGSVWSSTFAPLDREKAIRLARRTIVGNSDPAEVVMLDLEPKRQKTYCDFAATKLLFDVDACDPRELYVNNGRVYRRADDGTVRRVTRIYNRLVGDDLIDPKISLPFDMREDVGLTWAAHPAWFWIWSKASLPALDHPAVPKTRLLSDVSELPEDLERYVLKPLFSYAGSGVNVGPKAADIAAIPEQERSAWCLMERIDYAPALVTPEGDGVKVEVRVMLMRPDDETELVPTINLARLSRGLMHGVDHNKNMPWTGSSIAMWSDALV